MAEVGAAAGVTGRTVSNVLSGKGSVSPTTRQAVLLAAEELGYTVNASARGLRTGKTGQIALALPTLAIDYYAELAAAVLSEADSVGLAVAVLQTFSQRDRELAALSGAGPLRDGLLLQPHALGAKDLEKLVSDHPLVLLGDNLLEVATDQVCMDNLAIAKAATEHLLARGRSRVAMIGPHPAVGPGTAGAVRLQGYQEALREAGLACDPHLVVPAAAWTREGGAAAVRTLLSRTTNVDAVFCGNDSLALGALYELQQLGFRVPEHIAVMGVDNIAASAYSTPSLTSIDGGGSIIARTAVRLLASTINLSPPSGTPQRLTVPWRMHQRAST